MRHMVRVLVGTMLDVAAGRRAHEDFVDLLEGAPRRRPGRRPTRTGSTWPRSDTELGCPNRLLLSCRASCPSRRPFYSARSPVSRSTSGSRSGGSSCGSRARESRSRCSRSAFSSSCSSTCSPRLRDRRGAVDELHEVRGASSSARALALMLVGGFSVGSAGLALLERRMRTGATQPPIAGGATNAMTVEQTACRRARSPRGRARCAPG